MTLINKAMQNKKIYTIQIYESRKGCQGSGRKTTNRINNLKKTRAHAAVHTAHATDNALFQYQAPSVEEIFDR
jgi:hypothetical protein